jgi:non-heme chloroperoxidase
VYQSLLKRKNHPTLIFLHGWASSSQCWLPILGRLTNKYNLYAIDLPYPKDKVQTLESYCQFILDFIKTEKIVHPVLVGHSLGGAIAAKIAADYPKEIKSLVLVSAAVVRHQLPSYIKFFQKFSRVLHPIRRPLLKLFKLDASDYIVLKTNSEKQTFQNLLKSDLSNKINKITCPTLILWGDTDRSTPISDGRLTHQLIPQSQFYSFSGGHFFFLDHQPEFTQKIINFVDHEA